MDTLQALMVLLMQMVLPMLHGAGKQMEEQQVAIRMEQLQAQYKQIQKLHLALCHIQEML